MKALLQLWSVPKMAAFVGVVSLLGGIFVKLRLLRVSLIPSHENLSSVCLSAEGDIGVIIAPSLGASLWRARLIAVVRSSTSGSVDVGAAAPGG